MAAASERLQPEATRPLLGLLNGIAQAFYYGNAEITEELLRDQLYPDLAPQEFRALRAKMTGIVKSIASADMDSNQLEAFLTAQTKKPGGITNDQAAVIAKFWKNHRMKIQDSLINQSRWGNTLKNINWRVDIKSQSRHMDQLNSPVAIVEMELGKNGQVPYIRTHPDQRSFPGEVAKVRLQHQSNDSHPPLLQGSRGKEEESEFLTLEFDEIKLNQMLKKLSEIEGSITSLTQAT